MSDSKTTAANLGRTFPEPTGPLLTGPGASCSWHACMGEMAVQVNHWLRHYSHGPPPPAWEERFVREKP